MADFCAVDVVECGVDEPILCCGGSLPVEGECAGLAGWGEGWVELVADEGEVGVEGLVERDGRVWQ